MESFTGIFGAMSLDRDLPYIGRSTNPDKAGTFTQRWR